MCRQRQWVCALVRASLKSDKKKVWEAPMIQIPAAQLYMHCQTQMHDFTHTCSEGLFVSGAFK